MKTTRSGGNQRQTFAEVLYIKEKTDITIISVSTGHGHELIHIFGFP